MRFNRVFKATAVAAGLLLALAATGCSGDPFHMMPESASLEADKVDELTYLIFWVTNVTFVLVQACLVYFLFAYRRKPGVKAKHVHGNHAVELIWTVTPALILVFLALYQMSLWSEVKASGSPDARKTTPMANGKLPRQVRVQLIARQYEWHVRYPGKDDVFGTADDMRTEGVLVVPNHAIVDLEQRSLDVIHSFYLPNFRFKQDVVPGLHTKLWFQPTKLSADRKPIQIEAGKPAMALDYWDIVCAELCGVGHTGMAARLYVVTDEEYDQFIAGKPLTKLLAVQSADPAATRSIQLQPWDRTADRAGDAFWRQWSEQDDQTVKKGPLNPKHPFTPPPSDDEEEGE